MKDKLLSAAGALVGLVGAVVLLSLVALINGGYVYRTQCPTLDGGIRTKWSYNIFNVLPYVLAPTETGCEVHSATRVLASRVGIAGIETPTASELIREYADEASDPSLVYWSRVHAVILDLQAATKRSLPLRESFALMERKGDELRALAAPAFVKPKHERMLAAYDQSIAFGLKSLEVVDTDRPAAEKLVAQSLRASERFVVLADEIRAEILRRQ